MRDRRFVAERRGGSLTLQRHRELMQWAIACAEHVLPYFGEKVDPQLQNVLRIAKAWTLNEASVGDARKAAVDAHSVARQASSPEAVAVARAVGHTAATAHMADHALGSALHGLKAVEAAGGSVEAEQKWQLKQLPPDIEELVLRASEAPMFRKFKL